MNCQLYEERDLIYSSGLSTASVEKLKKNHKHFTIQTRGKTSTRQLPALRDNNDLTPDVTKDDCSPHNAARPLYTASAAKKFPSAKSHTPFLYITTMSGDKKLS